MRLVLSLAVSTGPSGVEGEEEVVIDAVDSACAVDGGFIEFWRETLALGDEEAVSALGVRRAGVWSIFVCSASIKLKRVVSLTFMINALGVLLPLLRWLPVPTRRDGGVLLPLLAGCL